MACRQIGAKPTSEPMLPYCPLDHKAHIFMKYYSKFEIFIQGNKHQLWNGSFVSASMC